MGFVSNAPPAAVFGLRMEHSGALAVCVFSQGTINHFIEFTPTPVTPSNSCLRTKWVFCSQRDSSIGGDSVHIWLSPSASPLSLSQSHSTTEGSQPNPFMKVNVFLFEVHVTFPPPDPQPTASGWIIRVGANQGFNEVPWSSHFKSHFQLYGPPSTP